MPSPRGVANDVVERVPSGNSKDSGGARPQDNGAAQLAEEAPAVEDGEEAVEEEDDHVSLEPVVVKSWWPFCRRRRERRARNAWVKLGSRKERQADLRTRYAHLANQQREIWDAQKLPRRKIVWRLFRRSLSGCWSVMSEGILGCIGRIDHRTGLPTGLLERYHFITIAGEGPHGWVFKVLDYRLEDKHSVEEAPQEAFSAIRVRDKARGYLLELNLNHAGSLIRKEVRSVGRVGRLRRCCTALGCMRPKFTHGCILEQRRLLQTNELFIEITEYMRGGSLQEYLQESLEALDEYSACHIISRVLSALQYMHKRRLMHRDVRLSQILLPDKADLDNAKLGDLWCVTKIPRKGYHYDRRRPVDILSTAPEVLMHGAWSEKADVWSVGCALFELLYGHPPFGGHGSALLDRICHGEPEFDKICGTASPTVVDLLRQLLRRSPVQRPTAAAALSHQWFRDFGGERPKMLARRTAQQIRGVRLMGKGPPCKAGMPATNLLVSQAGVINTGFCTYMGLKTCNIDFEVTGPTGVQDYWITACIVALWGSQDNPRIITLQDSVRPGAPFMDIEKHVVESPAKVEARMELDRPMRRVRLFFRQNFGGVHGITVRKVSFYGYEVQPVPIALDFEKCTFERGTGTYLHHDELDVKAVSERVHSSLIDDLKKGRRIAGSNRRYSVLMDITSGLPHHSSRIETQPLELPSGVVLIAAVLGLRYVSVSPPRAMPPRMRVQMLREVEGGTVEKTVLFETEDLEPPEWSVDDILDCGYTDYPSIFKKDLSFSTDDVLRLEVIFENNSGIVHIPAKLGLVFYYVPEATTFISESSESDAEEQEGEGGHHEGGAQEADKDPLDADGAQDGHGVLEGTTWEEYSEHAASEQYEKELQEDNQHVLNVAHFGALGRGPPSHTEAGMWRPYAKEPGNDGVLWPPWWDQDATEVKGNLPWEASTEEGEASARSGREEGGRGPEAKGRRASKGGRSSNGSERSQELSAIEEPSAAPQEAVGNAEAVQRKDAQERATQQLGIFKREALQHARARTVARASKETKEAEEQRKNAQGVDRAGAGGGAAAGAAGTAVPGLEDFPRAAACCAVVVPASQLDTCTRGLQAVRKFASSPTSAASRGVGPLALCGFTPSPPPPSPRK